VIRLFVAFFAFGTGMCLLTIVLLAFPGTALDALWRVNPEGHEAFAAHRALAFPLMATVGIACASAAVGLAKRAEWGRRLAIGILAVNLLGDLGGAILRHDPRTLIGLPIGGAMIWVLCSKRFTATGPFRASRRSAATTPSSSSTSSRSAPP
jgi:hypothetical protein